MTSEGGAPAVGVGEVEAARAEYGPGPSLQAVVLRCEVAAAIGRLARPIAVDCVLKN